MAANVQDTAKDVVHSAPVRALGRAGLVAYGVVHMLIAALAVQVAFGDSEQVDKSGALGAIAANGFGVAVLWLIVVALGALVVWQLAEAVWGHRGLPLGRRLLRSAVNVGEAVVFGVLARSAASIAAAGGNKPKASLAATLFGLPGGRFLVGLIGVAILVGAARSSSPGSAASAGPPSAPRTRQAGCSSSSPRSATTRRSRSGSTPGSGRSPRSRSGRCCSCCSRSGWVCSASTASSTPGTARPERQRGW